MYCLRSCLAAFLPVTQAGLATMATNQPTYNDSRIGSSEHPEPVMISRLRTPTQHGGQDTGGDGLVRGLAATDVRVGIWPCVRWHR
jgi:hypothetical protein